MAWSGLVYVEPHVEGDHWRLGSGIWSRSYDLELEGEESDLVRYCHTAGHNQVRAL